MIVLGAILISLYYFPVTFAIFPIMNSKNLMAGVGILVAVWELLQRRSSILDRNIFIIMIFAILVSLTGLFSVVYNETPDYTYASYIKSFFIWLLSANVVVSSIRRMYGYVSVALISNFLIIMCVAQCMIALLVDTYPIIKNWVDANFIGMSYYGEHERLYGLGAALDVAGGRFAAVLLMIAFFINKNKNNLKTKWMFFYVISFLFILIVGSMIGRTTTVGGILAILYLIWVNRFKLFNTNNRKLLLIFSSFIAIGIFVSFYLYQKNPAFKENIRFAFEGFFNWWEIGEWKTTSTNRWKTMFIWPDNIKTWIIGDGYFNGPSEIDPNYVGPTNYGYYKWTDIGYLRFIFYFGLIGLFLFILYFCKVAMACMRRFPMNRMLFLFLLMLNFIIWCKVATDIFLVFALFLCVHETENEEYENSLKQIQ